MVDSMVPLKTIKHMKNKSAFEIIDAYAIDDTSGYLEKAKWRAENDKWLVRSASVAVLILMKLRKNKEENIFPRSQVELADKMGISSQRVNIIVKGQENFTFKTISEIEKALNIALMDVFLREDDSTDYNIESFTNNQMVSLLHPAVFGKIIPVPVISVKNQSTQLMDQNENTYLEIAVA
jgi:DNA-binding Xre family transcriptional regulator